MRTSALAARLLAGGVASILLVAIAAPAAQAAGVTGPVQVTTQPTASSTIAVGGQMSLTSAATDSLDADVPVEAWQRSDAPDGVFADIPATAGLGTYTIATTVLGDSGVYRAAFPDGSGGRVFSNIAVVNVGTPATVGSISGSSSAAPGGSIDLLAQDLAGTPPLTVLWESSSSASGPWSTVTNTSAEVGVLAATAVAQPFTTVYYRATASNDFGSDTTPAFSVTTTDWTPLPVASVTVTNPSPGVLKASWPASSAGGASVTYRVEVLNLSGTVVRTTSTASLSYQTTLPAGSYRVRVITTTGSSDADPTYSAFIKVKLLVRTGSVSPGTVRPFADGYQDYVTLKATSTFPASGSIKVRNGSGTLVRSFALSRATAWSVKFNGRTATGARLPNGTYKVQFTLGGTLYVTRNVVVAETQVGTPSAAWSAKTVYPVKDGYADTAKLTVRTTVPATQKLVIRNSAGRSVYSTSLSRRTMGTFTWSGRSNGGVQVPGGTYYATVTVKAGEGVARSVVRGIVVSPKKLTAVPFTGYITAVNAFDVVISGDYDTGIEDGGLGLWSSPGLGNSIYGFSAALPSSTFNKYSNLKLYGCGYSYSNAAAGIVLLDRNYNDYGAWNLGNAEGCYGGSVSPSLLSGRNMYWAAGNVGENYSWYWMNYFKITGSKYVLK